MWNATTENNAKQIEQWTKIKWTRNPHRMLVCVYKKNLTAVYYYQLGEALKIDRFAWKYNKCCINLIETIIRKAALIITDRSESSQAKRLRRLKVEEQINPHFLLKCESCRAAAVVIIIIFILLLYSNARFGNPIFFRSFFSFIMILCDPTCVCVHVRLFQQRMQKAKEKSVLFAGNRKNQSVQIIKCRDKNACGKKMIRIRFFLPTSLPDQKRALYTK